MNARWQQALVFLQCSGLLAWLVWAWPQSPRWALAGLALAWLLTLVWLALPFALMRRVNRHDPAPPLPAALLLRAWWREARTALWVFAWLQPFRHRAEPDYLPAQAQAQGRAVLLLHGFMCNRGLWNPWLRQLRAQGRPCMALTLEPAFGSIDAYAPAIEAAVQRLQQYGGQAPLIIGHSMGGLAIRAWLRAYPQRAAQALDCISLGTPHHGTWAARLSHLRNGRQMRLDSAWLRELAATEPQGGPQLRWRCWYSNGDNIVFPAHTATLAGAQNHVLIGVGHLRMVYEPAVLRACLGLEQGQGQG